jgi:hypothetical protein
LGAAVVIPGIPVRIVQILAKAANEAELARARELAKTAENAEVAALISAYLKRVRGKA